MLAKRVWDEDGMAGKTAVPFMWKIYNGHAKVDDTLLSFDAYQMEAWVVQLISDAC